MADQTEAEVYAANGKLRTGVKTNSLLEMIEDLETKAANAIASLQERVEALESALKAAKADPEETV